MNNRIRYQKSIFIFTLFIYNNSVQSEGRAMLRGSRPPVAGFWHMHITPRNLKKTSHNRAELLYNKCEVGLILFLMSVLSTVIHQMATLLC